MKHQTIHHDLREKILGQVQLRTGEKQARIFNNLYVKKLNRSSIDLTWKMEVL